MDSDSLKSQTTLLRLICNQLDSAKSASLPSVSKDSTPGIHFCRNLLALPDTELRKLPNNAGSIVNRFRTKISSLIQDRNEAHKLAAICIIKASIHAGGYEIIAKSGHWMEGLIRCLASRSPALRQLSLRVVVSIYKATHGQPSLLREIATPTLPRFIKGCIDLIAPKSDKADERQLGSDDVLITAVFQAFCVLLPHHSVTFRPFTAQITEVLAGAIVSLDGETQKLSVRSDKLRALAQTLHALLPRSATKAEGGPGGKWLSNVLSLRRHIELTADEAFRSVEAPQADQYRNSLDLHQFVSPRSKPEDPPSCEIIDGLRLKKWVGVTAGMSRIVNLLHTLEAYISTKGNDTYNLPVQRLVATLKRLLSVFSGQHLKDFSAENRRPEYTIEEAAEVFMQISKVHVAALECLDRVMERLGPANKALANGVIEDLLWRLREGVVSPSLRSSFYNSICIGIESIGPGIGRSAAEKLVPVLNAAAADLFPNEYLKAKGDKPSSNGSRLDADAYVQTPKHNRTPPSRDPVVLSAQRLMETTLRRVPAASFSNAIRTTLDRSVILSRHSSAMLASVLNTSGQKQPSVSHSSIIPLLGREYPSLLQVEGLIRPRMPMIKISSSSSGHPSDDDMALNFAVSSTSNRAIDIGQSRYAISAGHNDEVINDGRANMEIEDNNNISGQLVPTMQENQDENPIDRSFLSPVENLAVGLTTQKSTLANSRSAQSETEILPPKRARSDEAEEASSQIDGEPKRVRFADVKMSVDSVSSGVDNIAQDAPAAPAVQTLVDVGKSSYSELSHASVDNEESDSDDSDIPTIIMPDDDETDEE